MPDYRKAAIRAARKYGIDPGIFIAQLRQESGLRPGLTSKAGAQGIAQFIPSTAKAYGVNLHDNRVTDDLEGAARYMRDNLKRTGGNYHRALSIYNSGRPEGYKRFGETRAYVARILDTAGREKVAHGPYAGNTPSRPDRTVTRTIPGVDRSLDRQQLLSQYLLSERGRPGALLGLKSQLDATTDTPSRTVTRTIKGAPAASASSSSSPRGQSKLLELFYNGPGGVNVKDAKRVPRGFVSGHTDHVHVAAGPKTIQALARLAQQHGLTVRELAPFDKVDPVHVQGSYHYKNEAFDASGSPKAMAAFSRLIARRFGVR